jgi:hypothetical protein
MLTLGGGGGGSGGEEYQGFGVLSFNAKALKMSEGVVFILECGI